MFILFVCFCFVFFCPTDRPTFTRGKAMENKTFYGDGLKNSIGPQPGRGGGVGGYGY